MVLVSLKFKICIFSFTTSPFNIIWWYKISVILCPAVPKLHLAPHTAAEILPLSATGLLPQPKYPQLSFTGAVPYSYSLSLGPHMGQTLPPPLYGTGKKMVLSFLPILSGPLVCCSRGTQKMATFRVVRERQPAQAGLDETSRRCSLDLASPGKTALLCCQLSLLLLSQGAAVDTTMPGLEWKLPWWLMRVLYLKAASNKGVFKSFFLI